MPPDSWRGYLSSKPVRSTAAIARLARESRSSFVTPARSRPNATLSMTVSHGNKLNACHTVDIAGRAVALPFARSRKRNVPCVGSRKPRAICSSVLLPQPLGPINAVTLPGSKPQVTASSAVVGVVDAGANVNPISSNSIATAGIICGNHVNGLLLLNLASASAAGDKSNSCSFVTVAFTSLILFQNLPCSTQDSTLGIPFSSNQVQRGAARSIKGAGTLVASEIILITSASFAAAALLKRRPA